MLITQKFHYNSIATLNDVPLNIKQLNDYKIKFNNYLTRFWPNYSFY